MRAMIVALAILPLPSIAAAAVGDVGVGVSGLRDDGVTPAMRLRGGWYLPTGGAVPVAIEAQAERSLRSDVTTTTLMAGATLLLPIPMPDESDGPAWTLGVLLGTGRIDRDAGGDRGLAWQAGGGMRWFRGPVVLSVEAGYRGIAVRDAPAGGPFLATGIAWRLGR